MAPKETRSAAGSLSTSGNTITGYIATFNSLSRVINEGGRIFREQIKPGAFARSLKSPPMGDIVALWNHEEGRPPLGRTSAGTLKLWEDEHGLRFELEAPSWAGDIVESVKRGDVTDCSFGMVKGTKAEWKFDGGEAIRTLTDVAIDEVSLVVNGMYLETSCEVRNTSHVEIPDDPDLSMYRLRSAQMRKALAEDRYRK